MGCVCLSAARVSFCFFVVLAEMRTVLLQTRPLFEVDFAGRGAYAGVCGCPTKGTDPSYLICCLCFVLARSVLLLVAGAKTVVFSVTSELAAVKGQ